MYPEYFFEYPNMNANFPFYMKRKLQWKTPVHRHDFVELTLVVSGKGEEHINGASHQMLPGTMVLLLPYQVHEIIAEPNSPLDLFICNFAMDVLTELCDKEIGLRDLLLGNGTDDRRAFVQLENPAFGEMQPCFNSMLEEYESPKPFKPVMLKAHLQRALTQYARSKRTASPEPSGMRTANSKSPGNTRSIWPVVNYIHEHYLEPVTLRSLSQQFSLHPSSLSEMFVRQYGIHFTDFLHELRVRHACSLLLATDLSIAGIAEESGFGSYSSLVRVFHKTKGLSPREYQLARHSNREDGT
ncbi:MAG: transcriptional regulator, AraC family [Paenibacillaceae bacterium]|nr:transcriptional regulator, AraC family [Paenibacillaceae bacterium]